MEPRNEEWVTFLVLHAFADIHFSTLSTNNFRICLKHRRPQIAKTILRRTEPKKSHSLTSDYTRKLQSSKQYGTGTKTDTKTNESKSKQVKTNKTSKLLHSKGNHPQNENTTYQIRETFSK